MGLPLKDKENVLGGSRRQITRSGEATANVRDLETNLVHPKLERATLNDQKTRNSKLLARVLVWHSSSFDFDLHKKER